MPNQGLRFDDLVRNGVLEVGDGYRAKNEELGGRGPVFLRAAYLQDSGFTLEQPDRFLEETAYKFGSKVSQLGDVVVTTKGNSIGRVGRIRAAQVGAVYSPHLSYWRSHDPDVLDQSFLYYWSRGSEFLAQLGGAAYGTDMAPYLSLRDQLRLRITLQHAPIQKAIGEILGALDDKIELNRRLAKTLQATAESIFKDWFIEFGPTCAKIQGRTPYLARDIWELFPARQDEEHKPEGWIVSTIGEEVEVVGGSTPSTKEPRFWGGDIAWSTPKDLSLLSTPILLSTERRITNAGLAQIASGLLPVGTVLLSSRAPIGYLAIAQVATAVNQGFIAMICRKRLSTVFVWLWTQANMETVHQKANGSTFQEISKASFRPISIVVAKPAILQAFDDIVGPLYDRIVSTSKENYSLAVTRDFLLPKLMSGTVTVKAAEHVVGQAT